MDKITKSLPHISVVMPVYNREKYVKQAIASILCQTYKNFELIVVNDASSDRTLDIIEQLKKSDNRITIINLAQNSGISYARNVANKKAKGEYIAIMDSDDIASPNRLEAQLRYMQQHDLDLCGTAVKIIGDKTNRIWQYPQTMTDIKYCMLLNNAFAHYAIMIKTKLLLQFPYNESLKKKVDYEMLLRILSAKKIKASNLNAVLASYRQHPQQITKSRQTKKQQDIIAHHINECREKYIDNLDLPLPFDKATTKNFINGATKLDIKMLDKAILLERCMKHNASNKQIIHKYFMTFYRKHIYIGPILFWKILNRGNIFSLRTWELLLLTFSGAESAIHKSLKRLYYALKS